LRADEELRGEVNRQTKELAAHMVSRYRDDAVTVISGTIERWDAQEASRRIELHVGRDLQFIRINGTVVGGLAGLLIHTITVTFG
jgi:uncharacterized membrane-anchored protein YjiN (DUF445 family)